MNAAGWQAPKPGTDSSGAAGRPGSPLQMRIGFAGHRSVDGPELQAALGRAFELVQDCAAGMARTRVEASDHAHADISETILDAHRAIWGLAGAEASRTLLTGYAPGADRSAASVWRGLGLGPVHALFPFAGQSHADRGRYAWTDQPGLADTDTRVDLTAPEGLEKAFEHLTILDGASALAETPRRDPHVELARWLVRWSDVVVTVWDGKRAAGPGGTADVVEETIKAKRPLLWIDVAHPEMPVRFIAPQSLQRDGLFGEIIQSIEAGTVDVLAPAAAEHDLRRSLVALFMPPSSQAGEHGDDLETMIRRRFAASDPLVPPSGWRNLRARAAIGVSRMIGWGWLKFWRCWGRAGIAAELSPSSVDEAADVIEEIGAGQAGGPATKDAIQARAFWHPTSLGHPVIEHALRDVDARANVLGSAHRGAQLLLLLLAVMAVVCATIPLVFESWKLPAVGTELIIVGLAAWISRGMRRSNGHQMWSDCRRLAERLRVLRATWPLGFDITDKKALSPSSWTEWQANAVRRAAGPPTGFMEQARRWVAAEFAREDADGIVEGQRAYHVRNHHRARSLHAGLEATEKWSLRILICLLICYLGAYFGYEYHLWPKPPKEAAGILVFASAVIPIIAAVCLAVEAKLDLRENERRSAELGQAFAKISTAMSDRSLPSRDEELLGSAAALVLQDVDTWRDAAQRRVIATL
ncbi:hypothetical protein [Mesorhizobium sp. B2-3-4]|uniref:hypothetical protein n=1 Tax=Mesorhizobium sp. B2-3-4 TaxID=2589959 RepID=UPI0011274F0B|nr:hypothetical protein [Mesorhizobium sp. B2-3-4]TPM36148.1 hypothetical protein FJ967_18830 [Mesorhizobium sp. B2-3-4]